MAETKIYTYPKDDPICYPVRIIDGVTYSRFDGKWKPLVKELRAGVTPELKRRALWLKILTYKKDAQVIEWKGNPYA